MGFLQLKFFDNFFRPLLSPRPRARPVSKKQQQNRKSDDLLQQKWNLLATHYFPDRMDLFDYQVIWGRARQKRVLASCSFHKKVVLVAQIFIDAEHQCWLEPLLYHEMCHAILGPDVDRRRRKRLWHGPRFKALESRHPQIPALNRWIKSGGWARAVQKRSLLRESAKLG